MIRFLLDRDPRSAANNWKVISDTAGTTPAFYPKVTWPHVERPFGALKNEPLAEIAAIFATAPYDLRAGWPDLTSGGAAILCSPR